MKGIYVEAELEIIELADCDIVTASGVVENDKYNNGTLGWGGYY